MTRNIKLPPEVEDFVGDKVDSGFYADAADVVRDALLLLQAEEKRDLAWRNAIQVGVDELDRGEGVPFTAKALNDITEAAMAALHSDKPMDPDVLP